ncbi:MAG: hypothetical protein A2283_12090 [Lentisphaerae bacterium RIFOXYA12_FULL_48_11]|nr:MAG: hypothetical protein A2283_12090 [Lentisphaerae bacterium RIFOXYA12_FULL_48_11]
MKKRFLIACLSVVVILSNISQIIAAPVGRSNSGREYLAGTQDLSAWSAGLYFMSIDRDVEFFLGSQSMKQDKVMGYVGYDVIPWITAYIVAGSTKTRIGWGGNAQDSDAEIGLGAMFNLLDTEIEDPTLLEDRLRINANIQYTKGSGTYADDVTGIDWYELSGSLTLSLVNDLTGDKFFAPSSIALFIGPAFSKLTSGDIEEEKPFGMTAGLDVFLNEKVSLEAAYTKYDRSTYSFGVNIHF